MTGKRCIKTWSKAEFGRKVKLKHSYTEQSKRPSRRSGCDDLTWWRLRFLPTRRARRVEVRATHRLPRRSGARVQLRCALQAVEVRAPPRAPSPREFESAPQEPRLEDLGPRTSRREPSVLNLAEAGRALAAVQHAPAVYQGLLASLATFPPSAVELRALTAQVMLATGQCTCGRRFVSGADRQEVICQATTPALCSSCSTAWPRLRCFATILWPDSFGPIDREAHSRGLEVLAVLAAIRT